MRRLYERSNQRKTPKLSRLKEAESLVNLAMTTGLATIQNLVCQHSRTVASLRARIGALECESNELKAVQAEHNQRLEAIALEAIAEEQARVRQVVERHLAYVTESSVKSRLERLMSDLQGVVR